MADLKEETNLGLLLLWEGFANSFWSMAQQPD